MTTIQVLDPAGAIQPRAALQLTAIAALEGRRVAVLDNAKPNFQRLATLAAERLCAEHGMTGVAHFRKENPSVGAEPALLDEIALRADLVLTDQPTEARARRGVSTTSRNWKNADPDRRLDVDGVLSQGTA